MENTPESTEAPLGSSVEEETVVTPSPVELVGDEAPVETIETEPVETAPATPDTPDEVTAVIDLEESDIPAEPFDLVEPTNPYVTFDPVAGRYSEPHRKHMRVPVSDAVIMPTLPLEELNRIGLNMSEEQIRELETTEEGAAWLSRLAQGQQHAVPGDVFTRSLQQPDSEWVQRPEHEGERLGIARPRFSDDSNGGKLTGQQAVIRMQQVTGMGALLRFPLYHTGIWITLKAMSDVDLLELDRRIANEKIRMGTATYGMVFSNTSAVSSEYLIQAILANVYSTTAPSSEPDDLFALIDIRDYPMLILGALSTQYPDGYPYERRCVAGAKKCQHTVSETLLLHKLSWTNQRRLTAEQKKHMSMRSGKRTAEDLKRYRDAFVRPENVVKVNELMTITLRSPSLAQWVEAGHNWIDSIKDAVDASFGATLSARDREQEIVKRAEASTANQYSHYIERIVIRNERANTDNFVDGPDDIREALAILSGDEIARDKLLTGIGEYIDHSTMSTVAIPRYHCPACKTDQGLVPSKGDGELIDPRDKPTANPDNPQNHPQLIPLDMFGLFFTITGRRIARVLAKILNT